MLSFPGELAPGSGIFHVKIQTYAELIRQIIDLGIFQILGTTTLRLRARVIKFDRLTSKALVIVTWSRSDRQI